MIVLHNTDMSLSRTFMNDGNGLFSLDTIRRPCYAIPYHTILCYAMLYNTIIYNSTVRVTVRLGVHLTHTHRSPSFLPSLPRTDGLAGWLAGWMLRGRYIYS